MNELSVSNRKKKKKCNGAITVEDQEERERERKVVPNYVKRDIVAAFVDPLFYYGDMITYGWEHMELIHLNIGCTLRITTKFGKFSECRNKLNKLKPKIHAATSNLK